MATKVETLKQQVEELVNLTEQIKTDSEKFADKENKAAGTRVRTGASALSKLLKELRKTVLEVREERESDKK